MISIDRKEGRGRGGEGEREKEKIVLDCEVFCNTNNQDSFSRH